MIDFYASSLFNDRHVYIIQAVLVPSTEMKDAS